MTVDKLPPQPDTSQQQGIVHQTQPCAALSEVAPQTTLATTLRREHGTRNVQELQCCQQHNAGCQQDLKGVAGQVCCCGCVQLKAESVNGV